EESYDVARPADVRIEEVELVPLEEANEGEQVAGVGADRVRPQVPQGPQEVVGVDDRMVAVPDREQRARCRVRIGIAAQETRGRVGIADDSDGFGHGASARRSRRSREGSEPQRTMRPGSWQSNCYR